MDDRRLIVNYQRSSTAEKDYRHRQLATDGWLPLLDATPAIARRADSISGQWWAQSTLRSDVGSVSLEVPEAWLPSPTRTGAAGDDVLLAGAGGLDHLVAGKDLKGPKWQRQ